MWFFKSDIMIETFVWDVFLQTFHSNHFSRDNLDNFVISQIVLCKKNVSSIRIYDYKRNITITLGIEDHRWWNCCHANFLKFQVIYKIIKAPKMMVLQDLTGPSASKSFQYKMTGNEHLVKTVFSISHSRPIRKPLSTVLAANTHGKTSPSRFKATRAIFLQPYCHVCRARLHSGKTLVGERVLENEKGWARRKVYWKKGAGNRGHFVNR